MASEKIEYAFVRAVECLADFRKTFVPSARANYKLTLIARDATRPDGSRDIIVTEDTDEGIRVALDQRAPVTEGGADGG